MTDKRTSGSDDRRGEATPPLEPTQYEMTSGSTMVGPPSFELQQGAADTPAEEQRDAPRGARAPKARPSGQNG